MTDMTVHNLNGTADNEPGAPFGSWIAYWRYHKGKEPKYCPRCGKLLDDPVGAHVQKDKIYYDRSWYIVPICRGCNNANTSFNVDASLLLSATL